jgi:outer membrane biosynthesis protein TonB
MNRILRTIGIIALLPLFGLVFWAAATVASSLLTLGVIGVNVHGLGLASYAAELNTRPAPLSAQVMQHAYQDATGDRGTTASTTKPAPAAATAAPTTPAPAPTRPASPTPTPPPVPTPTPVPLPLPTPTPAPLPLPTPTPGPLPVPTPTPGPLPVPTPTPGPLPVPTPTILPSLLPGVIQ